MFKISALLISINLLLIQNSYAHDSCLSNKYIFDIGSGGIKSTGYLINKCHQTIVKTLAEDYDTSLSLQECISNSPGGSTIPPACISNGEKVFSSIKKKLGINCAQQQCRAVATAWARNAHNSHELINAIEDQGIKVSVLSQENEGKLSFLSLSANHNLKNTMVLDLGGGSFQLSSEDSSEVIQVHNGPYGMFNFKPMLLAKFDNSLPSASLEAIKQFALDEIGAEISNKSYFKNKSNVLATGAFITRGVQNQFAFGNKVSLKQIEAAVANTVGKSAAEICAIYPKLPAEHAVNSQFSLLIIYAVMKSAGIDHITIVSNNKINEYLALHEDI